MSIELKIIGVILILFAGYLGYQYRHTGFDESRFEKWRENHLRRFPNAEDEEAEEWFRTHQQGAPLAIWLKKKYLRQLELGKIFALIFASVGTILTTFG